MHTFVLSDLHLSDAEPADPRRPFWKAFRRREHFVDGDLARLLGHLRANTDGPLELVLNGDVFDFDTVMQMPDPAPTRLHWLMHLRGLGTEAWMSEFKIQRIIADHPEFFAALRDWVGAGHKLVFVVGNHDLELHWPTVQSLVRDAITTDATLGQQVVFCAWFYLSGGDTFVSHGSQYDPYCVVPDPVHPFIRVRGRARVRLPFGDLANKYMLNGMGYFNPHATQNYIMSGVQYVKFFLRYMVRDQPLLLWTWLWSATATLLATLAEFLRPAMRDPLTVEQAVHTIAERSQASPAMVRQLSAVDVPSACTRPLMIVRELWLDRALLFLAMVYGAFQLVTWTNWFVDVRLAWVLLPLALLFPLFLSYSFRVKPDTFAEPLLTPERAAQITAITGARQAVMGHTHEPQLVDIGPLRYCNAGFWSAAFAGPECTQRLGTQSFAWIRPAGEVRTLELWEMPPGAARPKPMAPLAQDAEARLEVELSA
jgi:UDP-2,3-diacylglucosamine pyrophosphatase LpxH